jgi:spermidine synthase
MLKSNILKLSLFATGLSGIVAEYILATLATYFLGNSVLQWTMVLSIMLFAMGVGSRVSKYFEKNLLESFIIIEFILSILVAFSAMLTYLITAQMAYVGFLIYGFCVAIGFLIGMEIPLVVRLNNAYQELKENVSAVMENDYYGSLLGGLFFAFVGLPYLGLTYTPFVLGGINFAVAILLLLFLRKLLNPLWRKSLNVTASGVALLLLAGAVFAKPIVLWGEQKRYKDKVIYQEQTKYQKIVITEWKGNNWFYLNGNQQLSTLDEWLYHEPLVHPAAKLHPHLEEALVLGGGDGCAVRELLKYPHIKKIVLVDLDPRVTELAKTNPIFTKMNENALQDERVELINGDAYQYLEQTQNFFDLIICDFPDPKSIELGRLYSYEFYQMCYKQLRPHGLISIQSGSPYYATKAFICVGKTVKEAGFQVEQIHNQVITLGQWGWTIGAKSIPQDSLKPYLRNLKFDEIETRWINHEAMQHITSFGKPLVEVDSAKIKINRIHDPVLSSYYLKGNWEWY